MRRASKLEASLRTMAAVDSDTPFRERLVHFWSNHFTVSAKRGVVAPIAGAFEREAIRPHVTGRFADMLLASTKHPAMLLYLDNASSVGPNSPMGRRRGKGLNENLAREILELHTLGVDGGYSQDDVIGLARLITGWSIARPGEGRVGAFQFRARAHEPGQKKLLRQRFDQGGIAEGERALIMLARHPATARHVATKFARHFVSDSPPIPLIKRLEAEFHDTDGDLGVLAKFLIDAPEAWEPAAGKIKSPNDLVIATLRLMGSDALPEDAAIRSLEILDQFPFRAPSPAGWPDTAADWVGPETLMMRLEWTYFAAGHANTTGKLRAVLERRTALPVFSEATRREVARAESVREAIALYLASPEFQRR